MKRRVLDSCIVVCVSLFVLYQVYTYRPGILDWAISFCVRPILILQNSVSRPIRSYCARRNQRASLQKDYDFLRQKYLELQEENISLTAQVDYVEQTSDLQKFKARYHTDCMMCAQIIARTKTDDKHTVLVDIGSQHGVTNDMCAVYKNCLIGRVIETFPYMSRVQLVTDGSSQVPSVCSATKTCGICCGCNKSDTLSLDFVSHLERLEEGDLVYTSGEGVVFPRGFALGKVASYQIGPLHYSVVLDLLVDIDQITHCFLLRKGAYTSPDGEKVA